MRGGRRNVDAPVRSAAIIMSGFLSELSTKMADRWISLLVLPGLLWIAALAAVLRLGQEHPFDVARPQAWLDQIARQPASHDIATVALTSAAIVLASAAVALAASALGALLQQIWVVPGALLRLRLQQATLDLKTSINIANQAKPTEAAEAAEAVERVNQAKRRRDRLCLAQNFLPTRVSDRFYATAFRVRDHNSMDLDLVWPRLWTVLPDALRADLSTTQDAYVAAARLAAWGILYLTLAAAWWPAALIRLIITCTAALRARTSADVLADLVETAADLYTKDLAAALDVSLPGVTDPAELGRSITRRLQATPGLSHRPATGIPAPLPGAAPLSSSTLTPPLRPTGRRNRLDAGRRVPAMVDA
jgi:hypothetical protein